MKVSTLVAIGFIITANATFWASPIRAAEQTNNLVDRSFTVLDRRAHDEISEVSRLYINGSLASTFVLSLNHDSQQASIPIPLGRVDVPYVLCGEIIINRNGHIEAHKISSEGTLHKADGHSYEAIATDNFTDFYLIDYDDPYSATHKTGHSKLCSLPTS